MSVFKSILIELKAINDAVNTAKPTVVHPTESEAKQERDREFNERYDRKQEQQY